MQSSGFRWWHALGILVVANGVSAIPAGYNGDEVFYNSFALPSVAPPDWLFAPMWLFLNVTSLVAFHRVANSPSRPARRAFLISEGIGWVLFSIFSTVYFWMRSPILGAADTVLGLLVAVVSASLAIRIDRLSAALVGFRVLWLILATYVSTYAAVYNQDPCFQQLFAQ